MKKYAQLVCLSLILFLVAGCSLSSLFKESTKKYTVNGISVTMNDSFYEKDLVSQTAYLESQEAIFTALKEEFTELEAAGINKDATLKDYAEAVKNANSFTGDIIEKDGLVYFTYEKDVSGKSFFYLATVYKTDDAFWLINFAC